MAKQGQHKNDLNDQTKSKGRNRPSQSMAMDTGSYKKPETYAQQARQHQDPARKPLQAKTGWQEHPGHARQKYSVRARHVRSGRRSSDSNESQ